MPPRAEGRLPGVAKALCSWHLGNAGLGEMTNDGPHRKGSIIEQRGDISQKDRGIAHSGHLINFSSAGEFFRLRDAEGSRP